MLVVAKTLAEQIAVEAHLGLAAHDMDGVEVPMLIAQSRIYVRVVAKVHLIPASR